MYAYCTSSHMSKQCKKNGQSNITLVGYHGQPKFTSNIVHCPYKVPNCLDHHISPFKTFLMAFTL